MRCSAKSEKKRCALADCSRPARGRGYCATHYKRLMDGRKLDAPVKPKPKGKPRLARTPLESCRVSGCGRPICAGGLCQTHYKRRRTTPGDWSKPVLPVATYSTMTHVGDMTVPEEVFIALTEEAKARDVKRTVVIREILQAWHDAKRVEAALKARTWTREEEGDLGPEVPLDGLSTEERREQRDEAIRKAYAEGVPVAALAERYGDCAYHAVRGVRQPASELDARLPFGLPA